MASKAQVQYVSSVCEMFETEGFLPYLEDCSSSTQELVVLHIGALPKAKDQADLIKICQDMERLKQETPEHERVATQVRYVGGR